MVLPSSARDDLAAALVGDGDEVRLPMLAEPLPERVGGGALAERAVIELAGLRHRLGAQLVDAC